jgi:FAS-associated factor 2
LKMSTPDIAQLTAAQQEALQTYTSVTDQDPLAAIPLLNRAEWNVQIAIARFFDGEPTSDPLAEARASLPSTSNRQTANLHFDDIAASSRTRALPSARNEDLVEKVDTTGPGVPQHEPPFLLSVFLTPFNIMYRVFSTVLGPFSFLIPSFISRLIHRLLSQRSTPVRRSLPPADNARRFIREFSEEYGESHALPFVESGFNLTLDNAKRDFKFLLVLLFSPNHDDTTTYVRDTVLDAAFKAFLSNHSSQLLLWGGNVQDSEAYQVSASLSCTKFPFAALICQTNETGSAGMSVIMRAVGPMSAQELVGKLGSAITAQEAQLHSARSHRQEQQASRNLRDEQDSAYERSLAQDRERARRKREETEAQERAEREAREAADLEETKRRRFQQWRQWRAQSLPPEPDMDVQEVTRLSIRLPSGDRVVRKFRPDADLEELYAFVECYDVPKGGEHVDEPPGYEHSFGFRLVSPMPRTVFNLNAGGSIGERVGKGGNLIVEPKDESDS